MNRPALGVNPPLNFNDKLKSVLLSVKYLFIRILNDCLKIFSNLSKLQIAPPTLNMVQTMACGSCANENAYKAVFIRHNTKLRKGAAFTPVELNECVMNTGKTYLYILAQKTKLK